MKHIVLLSGGYDSSVLLEHLKKDLNIHPLIFHENIKYPNGTSNQGETNCLSNESNIFSTMYFNKLGSSDYIPARNSILVLHCVNSICTKEIEDVTIYIGLIKNFPRFPDGSSEWLESINNLLKIEFGGKIKVVAPFIDMTKDQVYKLGCKLGVKLQETFSCNFEDANGNPCGKCDNCLWRAKHSYPSYERRL